MRFTSEQIEIAKRISRVASFFQSYYFMRKRSFKQQFNNSYKALICFIENYAYQRQGAAVAYSVIAKMCLQKTFNGNLRSVTPADARQVWKKYRKIAEKEFNNLSVNKNNNPLNSNGGILALLSKGKVSNMNLALHTKYLIQNRQTKDAYGLIKSIRGIGDKITSLYLRDIAYLGKIPESQIRDQYYLQPVDTWVRQSLEIIFGKNVNKLKLREKQERIVSLCNEAGISAIEFNQGAWVLGSQFAGDFYTFKQIAKGKEDLKAIIREHIEDTRLRLSELEKLWQNLKLKF